MLSPDTPRSRTGNEQNRTNLHHSARPSCMDTKYRRSDLNRHSFYRNRILSPACLPISPRRHIGMVGFEPNISTIKNRVHNHFATFRGEGATFVRTASSLGDTSFLLHLCAHKYGSNSISSLRCNSFVLTSITRIHCSPSLLLAYTNSSNDWKGGTRTHN